MRNKIIALLAVALFAVASFSFRPVTAAQDTKTPVCKDAALLKEIGDDFTALGKELSGIAKLDAAGLYAQMITIANLRQKYEDKEWPTEVGCDYMLTQNIIVLATIQDYAVVELADKLKLDADMIAKNRDFMNKRLEKQLKFLTDLLPKASN